MEDLSDDVQTQQRVRQQISVPFLWEERPGRPKKEYCGEMPPPSPLELVPASTNSPSPGASVPFGWEEKPGKPLVQFTDNGSINNPFISNPEEKEMFQSYLDSVEFDVDGGVLPAKESSEDSSDTEMTEGGRSNSSSSSTVEYNEHGGDGDDDVSVVEFFFSFSTPDAGFLRKACFLENDGEELIENRKRSSSRDLPARRAPTLGELMLLSRKLSCARKIDIREREHKNCSKDSMKKKVLACMFSGVAYMDKLICQDARQ